MSTVTQVYRVILIAALLVVFAASADQKFVLRKLTVLNRHGHRAPNAPYWQMCPADIANRAKYDVNPEDLTGLGFKQEFLFGQYMRRRYGNYLGATYNRTLHFTRAVGEPRTLQSAEAVMQGIFPNGFGPTGYRPSRPQLVPVFADIEGHEHLLDDIPCNKRAAKDKDTWMGEKGYQMLQEKTNNETLTQLMKLCNSKPVGPKDIDMYVKIAVDGVIFNHDFGLNVLNNRIPPKMFFNLRNLSIQMLLGKLMDTDAQKTYETVDFPDTFISDFEKIQSGKKAKTPETLMDLYVGHREELYGFAEFFGFKFNVHGYPLGELPVSSTIILELLEDVNEKDKAKAFIIKMVLWTPYNGKYTLGVSSCKSPHLCTVQEVREAYKTRVARTGTWEKLCNYTPKP